MKKHTVIYMVGGVLATGCLIAMVPAATSVTAKSEEDSCCTGTSSTAGLMSRIAAMQSVPARQDVSRIEKWSDFLSTVAQKEDVCIVAPVVTKSWPPAQFQRSYGVTALPMLGHLLGSNYSITDGTVAFQVALDRPESAVNAGSSWVSDWIMSANDADVAAATSKDGLSLASIEMSDRLSGLARLGLPNEMLEGFIANESETKLSVRFVIDVRGKDSSGKDVRYRIQSSARRPSQEQDAEYLSFQEIPADSLKQGGGEIDFGHGRILTAKELRTVISQQVNKTVELDPRLDDSLLFVAGSYSYERLLAAIRYALTVPQVQTLDTAGSMSRAEVAAMLEDRLASVLSEFSTETEIDPRWAMERRTMSAAAIADRNVGFRDFLTSRGLDPTPMQVSLVPTVLFNVSAPGTSRVPRPDPMLGSATYHHSFTFAYHPSSG